MYTFYQLYFRRRSSHERVNTKKRRSKSSTSSTETESASPIPKRQKEQEPLLNEHEDAITEDGFDKKEIEPDEVLSALGLAQKFDEIISRLGKLDVITNQMQSLHDAVGQINSKIVYMENEVVILKRDISKMLHTTGELENSGREKKYPHKPRPILARFLRYPDREYVFSRRSSLERDEGFGIGIDLPKSVVEMRKKMIPKMVWKHERRDKGQRSV
ncbi:hypothetical protein QZH41_015900 [Actinostola sp. cb2023]|nr:hypothetical protein QZH41_015900 [Actinostola sp. cb2023]